MGITCNLELSALKFAVKDLRLVDGKLNLTLTADLTPAQIVATFAPPSAGQAAAVKGAPSASREWQRKPYFPVVAETPATPTAAPVAPALPAASQPENEPTPSEPVAPASVETPASVAPTGAKLPSIVDEIPLPPEAALPAIIDENIGDGAEAVASEAAAIDEPLISDDNASEALPAETSPVEKEIPAAEHQPDESPLPAPEIAIADEPLISDDGASEQLPAETSPVEKEIPAAEHQPDESPLPAPEVAIADEPLISDDNEPLPAESSPVSETVAAPEAPVSRYGEPQADDEFALALTNAHAAPQVAPDEDARLALADDDEAPRRDEIATPPATAVQPPEPAQPEPAIADSSLDVLASAPTTAFSYDLAAEIPPVSKPELALAPETPAGASAPRPAIAPPSSEFSYDLRPEESTPPLNEPAPPPAPPTLTTAAPSTADYEPQPLTPPPSVLHPNGIARSAPPETPAVSSLAPISPTSTAPVSAAPSAPAANKPMRVRYVCPRCQTPGVQDADKIKNIITCKNCGRAMRLTIKN
ncbi:MAG: hypothetical protein LBP75_05960 [Planctomycetota bacterium]|nr:hypothetical protein [Planctomycetota bacterium]